MGPGKSLRIRGGDDWFTRVQQTFDYYKLLMERAGGVPSGHKRGNRRRGGKESGGRRMGVSKIYRKKGEYGWGMCWGFMIDPVRNKTITKRRMGQQTGRKSPSMSFWKKKREAGETAIREMQAVEVTPKSVDSNGRWGVGMRLKGGGGSEDRYSPEF